MKWVYLTPKPAGLSPNPKERTFASVLQSLLSLPPAQGLPTRSSWEVPAPEKPVEEKPTPGYSQFSSGLAITLGPQPFFLNEAAKSAGDFEAVCRACAA